jgi:hypothetical protein
MTRIALAVLPCLFYSSLVLALEQERSNVTGTSWEIYGFVLAVVVIGALWLVLKARRDEKRKKRRGGPAAA